MLPVIFHPAARDEAREAADWYDARQPGLGKRFEFEMNQTIDRILENPLWFAAESGDERFAGLNDFPYSVIFKLRPDCIWVACVNHHKRRPGHWRSRTP